MKINPNAIKRLMGLHLMTQEQLAKEAGVARMTINGTLKKGSCSTITAGKIAKALGVDPVAIIPTEE